MTFESPFLNDPFDMQQNHPFCYCERCGGEIYHESEARNYEDETICRTCFEEAIEDEAEP